MTPKETSLCAVLLIACMCLPAHAQSGFISPRDEAALNAAAQRICESQISMIGEGAGHGDGHTLAFKVSLVERLIDRCGFNSVLFEASHYEFINLDRRLRMRQAVTA